MTKEEYFKKYPDVIAWIKSELKPVNTYIFEPAYLKAFAWESAKGVAEYVEVSKNYESLLLFWILKKLEAIEADTETERIIRQAKIDNSKLDFLSALAKGFKIVGGKIYQTGESIVTAGVGLLNNPMLLLAAVGAIIYFKVIK